MRSTLPRFLSDPWINTLTKNVKDSFSVKQDSISLRQYRTMRSASRSKRAAADELRITPTGLSVVPGILPLLIRLSFRTSANSLSPNVVPKDKGAG